MREVGVPSEPEAGAGGVTRVRIMLQWKEANPLDPPTNGHMRSLPLDTQSASGRGSENEAPAPARALLPSRFSD
jgi:hypothetical protein